MSNSSPVIDWAKDAEGFTYIVAQEVLAQYCRLIGQVIACMLGLDQADRQLIADLAQALAVTL